jgi:mono/diheme cytochrome c family protein
VIKSRAGGARLIGRAPGPLRTRGAHLFGAGSTGEAPRYLLAIVISALIGAAGLVAAGCHGTHIMSPAERGAVVYRTNCIACHNWNPNLPGALGPAIAGSSKALITARVLHGAYPAGYNPKRHSHIMRPLPWLSPHIDDLTAFLEAAKTN